MQIVFYVADENVQRIVDAINGLYPMPSESAGEFTSAQWAKERIRRFIVDTVLRYEQSVALQTIVKDDDLATILATIPLHGDTPSEKGAE